MSAADPNIIDLNTLNLNELGQFVNGLPHPVFDKLRAEAPVWYHPPNDMTPDGEGFWVVSRYADVRTILKDHYHFSSETGRGAREGGGTILQDLSTEMGPSQVLPMTDPPKHDDVRALVNQGFFPKTLKLLEQQVRQRVNLILDKAIDPDAASQTVDFLNDIASQLPLEVICMMGGIPEQDWGKMIEWADAAIQFAAHDPEKDNDALFEKAAEMGVYALGLVQQIRERPDDSVMSQVIHATIPGEDGEPRKLDDLELIRFFSALITGGTETTRNAMAYGFYQLLQSPDQYQALMENTEALLPQAIEEMIRWSSPVHFNRRTVSEDIEFNGHQFKRGEKVTIWYSSANRDDAVFDKPHEFDIFRERKSHIAFGYGIHHCIGAALARMEMRLLFEEFFPRVRGKSVEAVAPIRFIRSNRHQGVADMRIHISS